MNSHKTDHQVEELEQSTLDHYEQNAISFWEGTKDHDVSQNLDCLIQGLPEPLPGRVLDFGCGPGRDLRAIKDRGIEVIGLDGSAAFCEMARAFAEVEVWQQEFLSLNLPNDFFHGIFANASLFHVPRGELVRVLKELWHALIPGGVLFSSNPRGQGEGFSGGRYGNYMEWVDYEPLLKRAGFTSVCHYYRPTGKPLKDQPWLACLSRKDAGA